MRRLVPLALLAIAALAGPAVAQQAVNPIHPAFVPLDAAGHPVKAGPFSEEKTCGGCHDVAYVQAHTGHAPPGAKATCVQCHLDGGKLEIRPELLEADGRMRRAALRIGVPRAANCAACHGVVTDAAAPVALPPELELAGTAEGRSWTLTLGEGAIVSPQRMSDSFLDLQGKAGLAAPWDVHAAKLVDCVACHYAANNPARTDGKHASLRYLTADPRRQTTAEFLVRPDHRLAEQGCRGCHEPRKAHGFLPYRERHLEVLACQACHAAGAMAPAAEMIDATVVTSEGTPAIRYRNVVRRPGEPLNAAAVTPFQPLLVERTEADGARRLAPVNPVTRWRWVSGPDRKEVPFALVRQVFLEDGRYAPAILEALDVDRDGRLDERELRLDTAKKAALVAARLAAAGVAEPAIEGTISPRPLAHGISTRERALRDCDACHAGTSRVARDFPIAGYLPGGTPPRMEEKPRVELAGVLAPTEDGGLVLRSAGAAPAGLHVLGYSREGLSNLLGFLLFLAVAAGVTVHGLARLALRRRRGPAGHAPAPLEKAYVFGRYERMWHWTMALSGVVLILSGLAVHAAGWRALLPLPAAIAAHNAFAIVLMVNAFLALFYHLVTRAIRNFIPEPHGFLARVLEHMAYQSRGIFLGGPHPANAAGHKLNPLQQLTYLALLNVLFPLQIATGLLVWAVGQWPEVAAAVGGLRYVAPLHNAGAWLFLSFFVLHVYLVTTGRTPGEHLQSMITGYQAREAGVETP
ncbi:MAG TPA: cytochrome b/b6 domain-containing protein [Anaeromyxobacter sp.]|nr:cytochrome b/b6 domain-containing protein [Anaeromyxobacter sp.]